jgi:sortase A
VQRNGKEYHYEVTGKKIVKPDDVSVLKPTQSSQLTLITCYPTYYIGPAPERLVVFSRLSPSEGTSADEHSAGGVSTQSNSRLRTVQ